MIPTHRATRAMMLETILRWFARQDMTDVLIFTDVDDELRLAILVGEAFGGADAESLTPHTFPIFRGAWNDLLAETGDERLADTWSPKLFAARLRGTPQRWNRMPEDERIVKLFKAAARKDGAE